MTAGPATLSRPKVLPSHGLSRFSSSTIFISTPKGAHPCLTLRAKASSRVAPAGSGLIDPTEPSGLISVMPQAWRTSTPYSSSKAWIIDGGQAEPPMTTALSVERRLPCERR